MAHVVLQPRLWVVWICSTYLDPSLWPVTEILVCGWSMDYSSTDTCTTLGAKAAHTLERYRC